MPDEHLTRCAWLACAGSTWAMTGLIWFVQVVHYPLMALVGRGGYERYQLRHQSLTTLVVGPLMLTQAGSAVALAWFMSGSERAAWAWTGLGLVVLVFASTFLVQVPLHERLSRGFDERTHRRLVRSNWLRTAGWTAHALLLAAMAV